MALNVREVLCHRATLSGFDLFIQPILTSQITILLPLPRVLALETCTATLRFNTFCLLSVFIYLQCWGLNPCLHYSLLLSYILFPSSMVFSSMLRVRSFPWDKVKYKSALHWTRTKAICLCLGTLFSFLSSWAIGQSNETLKK